MNLFLAILLLTVSENTYAYLDPASGSAILYLVLAGVTSLVFYSRSIFILIYSKFKRLFNKESSLEHDYVIYSEGNQYWSTFKPLVEEFIKNQNQLVYLTSSESDPVFEIDSEYINAKYIGSEVFASAYLNYLRANILITTTPQLNVFSFKRSKWVKHFCHIVHAPIDVHTYRKFAFDFYDSVFCSGPHQIKSIQNLEVKRGTSPKKLFETGLLYYDNIKELPTKSTPTKTLLIAPTWKEYSLLNQSGIKVISELIKNYKIILRPHPQTFKSFPEVIAEIESKFKGHENFEIDTNKDGFESMTRSDLMVSDLSGVVWDYLFIHEKPVILYETPESLIGFEDTEIDHMSWEKELIKNHLITFNDFDIHKLAKIVEEAERKFSNHEFTKIKEQSLFNFRSAAPIAFNQLLDLKADLGQANEEMNG